MKRLWMRVMVVVCVVGLSGDAWALSQWSRKYGVSCTACHSAFPRLNAYGDAFMQNGYQLPGSEDGATDAKVKIDDNLTLNQLPDIFGIRLSFTPVDYKTESLKNADGDYDSKLTLGNSDWVQMFVGGTIMKNVSVFLEAELLTDEVELNWFHMGFHNLAGLGSYANIRVGRLSAFNWHAMTGRLRAIPPVKNQIFGYTSSSGKGDDSVAIATDTPAIEYYGYNNYLLWAVGVQSGVKTSDVNDEKNLYATLKHFLIRKGAFEGTAISVGGLVGTDTKLYGASTNSSAAVTGPGEAANDFWRAGPALNIRYGDNTDFQVAYFVGNDENWTLVLPGNAETSVDFEGLSAILGRWLNKSWWGAVQYDWIDSDDDASDYEKATLSIYFFPRENLRIGAIGRADMDDTGQEVNEAIVSIRTMF